MFDDNNNCESILTIEIRPDGVLAVNINNEVGWYVPDELRTLLIKGCVDAVDSENADLISPLYRTIESLKSSMTLEDLVKCDDDDIF